MSAPDDVVAGSGADPQAQAPVGSTNGSPEGAAGDVRAGAPRPRRRPEPAEGPWPGAAGGLTTRLRLGLLGRWVLMPAWAQALAVYAVTRLVDFVILDRMARFQEPSLWTKPDPGYLGVVAMWDSDWYRRIAESGYPSDLPLDDAGVVRQNEWAFYPLYPLLVRGLMTVTSFGFPLAATVVSLLAGAGCVVVMRALVERAAGRSLALWTVVLFCCYPASVVLQLPYAESLSMLLVVAVLWALALRRYAAAVPLLVLAGLSRPVAVPLAGVVAVHVLRVLGSRWRDRRREQDAVAPLRLPALVGVGLTAVASAAVWPVTAALVTGRRSAYTDTEVAWRVSHELTPLRPWWDISRYVLGDWTGPVVVLVVVVAFVAWVSGRRAVVIAGELRAWAICYLGYLLLVLDPFTALARLLVPMFPLGTLLAAASPSRAYRRAVAVAFIGGQVVWVCWLWRFSPPADWPP